MCVREGSLPYLVRARVSPPWLFPPRPGPRQPPGKGGAARSGPALPCPAPARTCPVHGADAALKAGAQQHICLPAPTPAPAGAAQAPPWVGAGGRAPAPPPPSPRSSLSVPSRPVPASRAGAGAGELSGAAPGSAVPLLVAPDVSSTWSSCRCFPGFGFPRLPPSLLVPRPICSFL